jgi:hypothetical protein
VTAAVLAGAQPAPDGRWALLVELVGSDWVHFVDPDFYNLFGRDLTRVQRLTSASGLTVLRAGYQDTASATYVELSTGDTRKLRFESCGMNLEAIEGIELPEDDLELELEKTHLRAPRMLPTG